MGQILIVDIRGRLGAYRKRLRMAKLARAGKVRLPRTSLPEDFWTLERPKDPEGKVLAALLEERGEDR